MSHKKQYTTALNNYLAGKISRADLYKSADRCGVSAAKAEADISGARDQAANGDRTAKADAGDECAAATGSCRSDE